MIITLDKAIEVSKKLKKENKKIVFTNGCFDILHIGHAKYLKKSKQFGDILFVGLNSDISVKKIKGSLRPINPENDRAELLSELRSVDYVIIFDEESPINLIEKIKPDIYTKGADYTLNTLPEADTVQKNGGRVEFITFVEGKSTTNVIKKIEQR